ncbi:hypothetical protein [Butyricimonas virosa]
MTNKEALRDLVADLQLARMRFFSKEKICNFGNFPHICDAKQFHKVEIDHHGFTLGGFFMSIRKLHIEILRCIPPSGSLMARKPCEKFSSGKGTPLFICA